MLNYWTFLFIGMIVPLHDLHRSSNLAALHGIVQTIKYADLSKKCKNNEARSRFWKSFMLLDPHEAQINIREFWEP